MRHRPDEFEAAGRLNVQRHPTIDSVETTQRVVIGFGARDFEAIAMPLMWRWGTELANLRVARNHLAGIKSRLGESVKHF